MISDERETAFAQAKKDLTDFFASKGVKGLEIALSEKLPEANKVSGKFKHIYKDFS